MRENTEKELFRNFTDKLNTKSLSVDENTKLLMFINKMYNTLLLPWLMNSALDGMYIVFLELGCGDGKYGYFISDYVNEYIGVDIRVNSVKAAAEILKDKKNCRIILNNGRDLSEIKSDSISHLFSYQSFQHMDHEIVKGYLHEIIRVLSEKGEARIHFAGPTAARRKLKIRWRQLGNINLKSGLINIIFTCIKYVLPEDCLLPVPGYNNVADNGWKLGALIKPSKLVKFFNNNNCHVRIEPSYSNYSSSGSISYSYWLIVTKSKAESFDLKYK